MIRFCWGELQLTVLDAGEIWLDGGAMFGVVPKPLWERQRVPDSANRIRLGLNLLLIEDGRRRTLIDTGAGTKWDDKGREIYGIRSKSANELLAPAGLTPDQIDRVINTHLHFDHAGGNTVVGPAGDLVAAYPNAEYVVQRGELETARLQNERIRASYLPENFEPLAEAGCLRLVDGVTELEPFLRLEPVPGHTPNMQMVLVNTTEGTVAFPADLVPTATHVRYPYIMAYDLEPLETLRTKKQVFPRAVDDRWRVIFEHDADLPLATLVDVAGRLVPRAVELEV